MRKQRIIRDFPRMVGNECVGVAQRYGYKVENRCELASFRCLFRLLDGTDRSDQLLTLVSFNNSWYLLATQNYTTRWNHDGIRDEISKHGSAAPKLKFGGWDQNNQTTDLQTAQSNALFMIKHSRMARSMLFKTPKPQIIHSKCFSYPSSPSMIYGSSFATY